MPIQQECLRCLLFFSLPSPVQADARHDHDASEESGHDWKYIRQEALICNQSEQLGRQAIVRTTWLVRFFKKARRVFLQIKPKGLCSQDYWIKDYPGVQTLYVEKRLRCLFTKFELYDGLLEWRWKLGSGGTSTKQALLNGHEKRRLILLGSSYYPNIEDFLIDENLRAQPKDLVLTLLSTYVSGRKYQWPIDYIKCVDGLIIILHLST